MPKSTKKQSSSLGPILLVAAGVVILLGLLLWQIISANSSQAASASTTVENIRRVPRLTPKKPSITQEQRSSWMCAMRTPSPPSIFQVQLTFLWANWKIECRN
jgi:cytoskeletal protein RodZ